MYAGEEEYSHRGVIKSVFVIQFVSRHINVNYDIMKTKRQFTVAVVINNDIPPLLGVMQWLRILTKNW